jgi:hypothetical protein
MIKIGSGRCLEIEERGFGDFEDALAKLVGAFSLLLSFHF